MQIEFKGRNIPVDDGLKEHVERRLIKVAKQISDLARLEIEVHEARNPRVAARYGADATLYMKRATLRASDSSAELTHTLNLVVDELARQVKRHRDKLRHRRDRSELSESAEPEGPPAWLEPQKGVFLAT